jgi:DNA-binding transcriptional MerR regulator
MKIGTLSRHSGLSIDTLRYYEKIGLLPVARRDSGGRRLYDDSTLRWIDFLKRLKTTGMPLAEMIAYARWRETGDSTAEQRRKLLQAHHTRMLAQRKAIEENLTAITLKIETYYAMEAAIGAASSSPENPHAQPVSRARKRP